MEAPQGRHSELLQCLPLSPLRGLDTQPTTSQGLRPGLHSDAPMGLEKSQLIGLRPDAWGGWPGGLGKDRKLGFLLPRNSRTRGTGIGYWVWYNDARMLAVGRSE